MTLEQMVNGMSDAQAIVDVLTHKPKAHLQETTLECFDAMIDPSYGMPPVQHKPVADNVVYLKDYKQ